LVLVVFGLLMMGYSIDALLGVVRIQNGRGSLPGPRSY
jgi:hypothetical protein